MSGDVGDHHRIFAALTAQLTAYEKGEHLVGNGKRGRGEGSIYRRKDGRWVGQYEVGGKRRYVYGKTRKEVATKLNKAIAERDAGMVFDAGSLRVGDYLDRWLDSIRDTLRRRTWIRHEEVVRLHLKPSLGIIKLDRINALQIQSLYRAKLDSGLSPRTVQIIHVTLHKALKQAVRWSLLPRNIVDGVDPPKAPKKEIKPLSEEQVKRLLEAAQGDKLEALYVLAITTGMRSGELLGLQWEDVNLQAGIVQVRRSIFNGRIEAPKSASGNRNIRLTGTSIRALREHERTGEWVFSSQAGTSISVHNLHNRSWKPLLVRAELPHTTRFHDLRHTCATLLLTKGVHPKIVQEMLGHSSITITLDTYSHVLPNMQEEAVEAMKDIFEDHK
jgi:integrase